MTALRPVFFAAALALVACSSVASPESGNGNGDAVADGSTFSMRQGQAVTLADASTLRYERLVNDSRCKPGVQCIWAGDAALEFSWRGNAGSSTFTLHSGKGDKSHSQGGRTVTLVAVGQGPAPDAQLRVAR